MRPTNLAFFEESNPGIAKVDRVVLFGAAGRLKPVNLENQPS
jgi:hypothetical protein